jgi:hypothetical protein
MTQGGLGHPDVKRKPVLRHRFFFRPHFGRAPNFTMWKIFLPRKKSCCVAQRGLLQQGKWRFSMRNNTINPLI